MPNRLPGNFEDLLLAPLTAVLSTLMPDGAPQASPVWYWFDGAVIKIKISTSRDRQKYRNAMVDPRAALTLVDPAKPLRYLEIRGLVEVEDDPDMTLRDLIGHKHGFADGGASLDGPDVQRVALVMRPSRIIAVSY